MDILAALAAAPTRGRVGRCKFQRHIDGIDTESPGYDELMALIDTETAGRIAAVFNMLGLEVSRSLVTMHRRGDCSCYVLT